MSSVDENQSLKIVTFNVFIGPPITNIYGPGHSLCNSNRLTRQIDELKKLKADIICLQEIYCNKILSSYKSAFEHEYDFIYKYEIRRSNQVIGESCIILLCCITLIPIFMFFTLINYHPSTSTKLLSIYLFRRYLLSCALFSFLLGQIKGFMITLIKKHSRINIKQAETIVFDHQSNDFQNFFRPRCYQKIILEINSPSTKDSKLVHLYHLHLNSIGQYNSKYLQYGQIINDIQQCNPDNVIVCGDFNSDLNNFIPGFTTFSNQNIESFTLTDSAVPFNKNMIHTWTEQNLLSKGFLLDVDARVDGILYRFKDFQQQSYSCIMNEQPFTSDHFGVSMDFINHTNIIIIDKETSMNENF